jgi:toxin ParE1/3/4
MPHPNRILTLTDLAEIDLESILQYTLENWGLRQMDLYSERLMLGMQRLLDNPEVGYSVSLNEKTYKAYRVEKHLIFYRASVEELVVLRILHERMDFGRHLLH